MTSQWLVLVESNTTGSGRQFCAAARQLGLRPLLLARDPARYPYVAADGIEHRVADTSTTASVLSACAGLEGQIAGVTSSSEYFIATAAQAAAVLGLPHPAAGAVRACRDKYVQRGRLADAGVSGPVFAAARTSEEAAMAASAIGFPVVVKPASGTGSIAVRKCGTAAEASAATRDALDPNVDPALPAQNMVLVEEYLSGAEYSVELIDERVVGITRKLLGPEPYFVEIGHDFPAPVDATDHHALGATAVAAVRALGLGWGGAHVELRYGRGPDPYIVEVNPRLAGGMIPRAVQEAIGIDMIKHVVAAAAGRPESLRQLRDGAASIRFLVARETGTVAAITGVAEASTLPGVVEVDITCTVGQHVVLCNSFRDRLGYVIAVAKDSIDAAAAADAALKVLDIQMAPTEV
jgi:biotin carboxylase